MTGILQLIQNNIDTLIVGAGLILAAFIFYNAAKLSSHKSRIDEAVNRNNNIYKYADGAVKPEADGDSSVTADTIRKYASEFYKSSSMHTVFSQLIPVFPLLGILGTVAGLMLEVQAQDIESMMASLDTALSSTLLGLVFAIFLKVVDAVYPSRIVNDVEALLDDYGTKMDLSEMDRKNKEDQ